MQVGADRRVAARDVEADADDRDLIAVRGDAANGHDIADVAVGHERGSLGATGDILQLGDRVRLVLAEDFYFVFHRASQHGMDYSSSAHWQAGRTGSRVRLP